MRFWWVNHKQTHKAEIGGGYLWSPKVNKNGSANQSYQNLTLVSAGDPVFSYASQEIRAVGVVAGPAREAPKPAEFGAAGDAWAATGWLVPVVWKEIAPPVRPKDHLDAISPLLPSRYSPLDPHTGNGRQNVYLAEISSELARYLRGVAGMPPFQVGGHQEDGFSPFGPEEGSDEFHLEEDEVRRIQGSDIPETDKLMLFAARVGQGKYRKNVLEIEKSCRLTQLDDPDFLVASHIKPWRVASNEERLDGSNGLMLAPHVDRLFDRGWISFEDDGTLLVANSKASAALHKWGLGTVQNVGPFTPAQCVYLEYHRREIYKGRKPK